MSRSPDIERAYHEAVSALLHENEARAKEVMQTERCRSCNALLDEHYSPVTYLWVPCEEVVR